MSKEVSMRKGNKGLTVKVNFFSLENNLKEWSIPTARLFFKGCVTHADTKEEKHFNHAGELLTILADWNADKFKQLEDLEKAKRTV